MKTYIKVDKYQKVKDEYERMGLPTDHLVPVDMNYSYVPLDKDNERNLDIAADCIKTRFGLGGE